QMDAFVAELAHLVGSIGTFQGGEVDHGEGELQALHFGLLLNATRLDARHALFDTHLIDGSCCTGKRCARSCCSDGHTDHIVGKAQWLKRSKWLTTCGCTRKRPRDTGPFRTCLLTPRINAV